DSWAGAWQGRRDLGLDGAAAGRVDRAAIAVHQSAGGSWMSQAAHSLETSPLDVAPRTLNQERIVKRVLQWSVLDVTLVVVIFPLYWMLLTASDPPSLSYSAQISLLPKQVTLAAFIQLLTEYEFLKWMWNSALVATASTVLAVVVGGLAAYSLSRLRYPGR